MRIAVPLSGGVFCPHFGRSTGFWVCDIEQGTPSAAGGQVHSLPEGGGCGAIPGSLAQAGVSLVIAGGIGPGAVQNLARHGIEVIAGVAEGTPEQIVRNYVAGRLVASGGLCRHHEHEGEHGHGGGCHGHERVQ